MNKSSENLGRPFVPYSQSANVLKSGISSFDDPSMLVSSQFSPILMSGNLIVTTCRNDRLDTAPDQLGSKLIAVIGTVSHQSFWFTMLMLSNFYSNIIQRASASFTSDGEAFSTCIPSGVPVPSANTISFVPLPLLVFPTIGPLFLHGRTFRL